MPKIMIKLEVPRRVTIDSAKGRISKALERLASENASLITDLTQRWDGYTNTWSFKGKGQKVTGKVLVGHNTVDITADLPFLLGLFKGQITDTIRDAGNTALQAS